MEWFYGSKFRSHNWMIFRRVLCCPLWPSCGWYCHGEESRSYGTFLSTFGDNSESLLKPVHMYPSKYECVNRWKLKRILKHGSKWVALQDVNFWQNPGTSMVFNWPRIWMIDYMYPSRVLTVESWNTLDLGSRWLWFHILECHRITITTSVILMYEFALQVILITPCVVLE